MSFSVAAFLRLLFLLKLARQCTGLYESPGTADRLADSSNDSQGLTRRRRRRPGLNLLFTSDEVKQCYGLVGKNLAFVNTGNKLHAVVNCRGGNKPESGLGDPIENSICVTKSSSDGGLTWGNFQVLSIGGWAGHSNSGCKMIYDSHRKNIIMQYSHHTTSTYAQLYQRVSSDDGKSWSNDEDITRFINETTPHGCRDHTGFLSGNGAGNRIQTPSGRIIFGGQMANGTRCLWFSDDGGKTYNTTGLHAPATKEFSIVVVGNYTTSEQNGGTYGTLLINSRKQEAIGRNEYRPNFWSFDDGLTWTKGEASQLKDAINQHGHGCEASMTNIDGKLYFFNPQGKEHSKEARSHMVVQCSEDQGKSWTKSWAVGETKAGGYSDLIAVDNVPGYPQARLMLGWHYNPDPGDKHTATNTVIEHIDITWCN